MRGDETNWRRAGAREISYGLDWIVFDTIGDKNDFQIQQNEKQQTSLGSSFLLLLKILYALRSKIC